MLNVKCNFKKKLKKTNKDKILDMVSEFKELNYVKNLNICCIISIKIINLGELRSLTNDEKISLKQCFIETESRVMAAWSKGGENRELLFN